MSILSIRPEFLTNFEKSLPHHNMIFVEGDEFDMGSDDDEANDREKPVHPVKLSSFYLGQYPVTRALWHVVMKGEYSEIEKKNHPKTDVSWDMLDLFFRRLNNETNKKYRLPTEAEWEFAARGGKYSEGYIYPGSDNIKEVSWYRMHGGAEDTFPIGGLLSNELGIHDMGGNVWEWCADFYAENYYQSCYESKVQKDPYGPEFGKEKIIRGSSWWDKYEFCRSTNRHFRKPSDKDNDIGFRLALSL